MTELANQDHPLKAASEDNTQKTSELVSGALDLVEDLEILGRSAFRRLLKLWQGQV